MAAWLMVGSTSRISTPGTSSGHSPPTQVEDFDNILEIDFRRKAGTATLEFSLVETESSEVAGWSEAGGLDVDDGYVLVSATGDWTKNVPREEYPAVRSIYELYDKPQNVDVVQFEAEHNYNKLTAYALLNHSGNTAAARDELRKERFGPRFVIPLLTSAQLAAPTPKLLTSTCGRSASARATLSPPNDRGQA